MKKAPKTAPKIEARWNRFIVAFTGLTLLHAAVLVTASRMCNVSVSFMLIHYPVFHFYLVFVLPASVGLCYSVYDHNTLDFLWGSTRRRLATSFLIALFSLLTAFVTYRDAVSAEIVPCWALKDSSGCREAAKAIRRYAKSKIAPPTGEEKSAKALPLREDPAYLAMIQAYQKAYPKFTPADLWQRNSALARVTMAFNFVYMQYVVWYCFYVIYILFLTRTPRNIEPSDQEVAVLHISTALLCLWFPFRLYTLWYSNFYNLKFNGKFTPELQSIILLAAAAVMILALALIRHHRTEKVRAISVLFGGVTATATGIGTVHPGLLFEAADLFSGFGGPQLALLAGILTLTVTVALFFTFRDLGNSKGLMG